MAKVNLQSGICGFCTNITATSEDGQHVSISYETNCPNIAKAKDEIKEVDAYQVLFAKPSETEIYKVLSKYLPHAACPVYSAFFKAIEVAAGMALPKDVHITIEK